MNGYTSPISVISSAAPTIRAKRSQVARACEWCRLNRSKCDDKQPCSACESRGGECSNTGKSGVRSHATATKQVTTRIMRHSSASN